MLIDGSISLNSCIASSYDRADPYTRDPYSRGGGYGGYSAYDERPSTYAYDRYDDR